jgi:hypothetical protein
MKKFDEIIYKGVSFYFREDDEGFLQLETDGHPVDRPNTGVEVLNELKQYFIDNQTDDDKEYQSAVRTSANRRGVR